MGKLLTLQMLRTSIQISRTWEKAKCSTGEQRLVDPWGWLPMLSSQNSKLQVQWETLPQKGRWRNDYGKTSWPWLLPSHVPEQKKCTHTLFKSTMAFSAWVTNILGWQYEAAIPPFRVKNDVSSMEPSQLILSGNYWVSWTCMEEWPLFQPLYFLSL